MPQVLMVGFGQAERERMLRVATQRMNCDFVRAASEQEVTAQIDANLWATALIWWKDIPTGGQLKLIQLLRDRRIPSIVVSDRDLAPEVKVAALEGGAVDCLDIASRANRLRLLLDLFVSRRAAIESHLEDMKFAVSGHECMLKAPRMAELLARLSRVAALSSTILLTGETGVGKTTLARWIHDNSDRHAQPFLAVPCAAIPASLLESELFGHSRGAFTGADRNQVGKFQAVGKGTLLLDEVDCFPLELQAKLLRAVEQRVFEPVGSHKPVQLPARFIVATNRPLEDLVAAGRFRADLYYRLQVLSFGIPPLRECPEAIGVLAEHFCREFSAQHGRAVAGFTPAAKPAILDHSWGGNIRELKNAVECAVALADGTKIQWSDLPEGVRGGRSITPARASGVAPPPDVPSASTDNRLQAARDQAERQLLLESLRRNNQNRSRTAADLGISRVTLYKRMERLGISPAT